MARRRQNFVPELSYHLTQRGNRKSLVFIDAHQSASQPMQAAPMRIRRVWGSSSLTPILPNYFFSSARTIWVPRTIAFNLAKAMG
jgi:hypothetical protein